MSPRPPKRAAGLPPVVRKSALPGSATPPGAPGTPPPAPSRASGGTQDREHPHPAEVSLPGSASLEPAEPGDPSLPPLAKVPREAAAGIPSPVTGAARLDRDAAPARGRKQAPAGAGTVAESSEAPAGSTGRTFTIALPPGLPLLSQNGRLHHFERNRRVQVLKKAAWLMALKEKIPPLGRVSVVVEYQPRDSRDIDPDNVPPASGKPCIDGLVAAGVLPDDNSRYVAGVEGIIGPKFPRGRLVLHLTEVGAATGDTA